MNLPPISNILALGLQWASDAIRHNDPANGMPVDEKRPIHANNAGKPLPQELGIIITPKGIALVGSEEFDQVALYRELEEFGIEVTKEQIQFCG